MHLVLLRQLANRLETLHRLQSHFRLERRAETSSLPRHSVLPAFHATECPTLSSFKDLFAIYRRGPKTGVHLTMPNCEMFSYTAVMTSDHTSCGNLNMHWATTKSLTVKCGNHGPVISSSVLGRF